MLLNRLGRKGWILCGGVLLIAVGIALAIFFVALPKEVNMTVDGASKQYKTRTDTVAEFLKEANVTVEDEDFIAPAVTSQVKDGMDIKLINAVNVNVKVDGQNRNVKIVPATVEEVLKDQNITLNAQDIVKPAKTETVTEGSQVSVTRVVTKNEVEAKTVKYKVKEKEDGDLEKGNTKVSQKGQNGKVSVTYSATYVDGKLKTKKQVAKKVIKKAKDKVVLVGTKEPDDTYTAGTRASANAKPPTSGKTLRVKAYAYCQVGQRTAMGTKCRRGAIAVDPKVIPLGTKVYVPGYGYATAEDTGGDIIGNTIDVHMQSEAQCNRWGVRYINIKIL